MNPEDIVIEAAAKAIRDHIAPAELMDNPSYDMLSGKWFGLVAIAPSGPLVRMEWKLSSQSK